MRKVIFADTGKIDFVTGLEKADIAVKPEEGEGSVVIDVANFTSERAGANHYFVPATNIETVEEHTSVYFELELYPFYAAAAEIINGEQGVLRFRRSVAGETNSGLIAADLFAFASLVGNNPHRLSVTSSDSRHSLRHIIILADFGNGKLAHLEYTFGHTKEAIELEWSGKGKILEFSSEETVPVEPSKYTSLPLSYTVDSVIARSKQLDDALLDKLNQFRNMVKGGLEG